MVDLNENIDVNTLVEKFIQVAKICQIQISMEDIDVQILSAPHKRPHDLPSNKKCVYVFNLGSNCLKVGQAGPNSKARFTSQHYNPNSAGSNLAKSILNSRIKLKDYFTSDIICKEIDGLTSDNIGEYIEKNSTRIHFFMDSKIDNLALSLLEIFLQCRLKPLFEGRNS